MFRGTNTLEELEAESKLESDLKRFFWRSPCSRMTGIVTSFMLFVEIRPRGEASWPSVKPLALFGLNPCWHSEQARKEQGAANVLHIVFLKSS